MERIDVISKLPVPILDHILSFLAIKDAARTSVLSKAWNNAWTSLSCLDFGYGFYHVIRGVVDQILEKRLNQKISIKRFKVNVPNYVNLDSWIKILVACNIKELYLEVDTTYAYKKLPEAIFAVKALNVLCLCGFWIELPSDGIKFSSLRELHLVESVFDELLIQALCISCSDLEVLSLRGFYGPISLQVARTLPKLRTVDLVACPLKFQMVDIAAPNMKDLYVSSSSGFLNVIKIISCKTLQHLNLHGVAVTDQWLENLLPHLPNLEIFYLSSCSLLKTMKISSNRLKYLKVVSCGNLTEVDLDTPNLLGFSSDVRYGKDIVDPLPTFHLKASRVLEASLNLIPETLDTNWYSKLTRSLSNFIHSKTIKLCCDDHKVLVIPKELRESLLPPLYDTNILQVKLHDRSNYSVVDIIDSMLWISPQLDTLSFGHTVDLKTLKFTYRDAADDEDEKPCCASLPWKCWRHELKKVTLQDFTIMELLELRNYFLTNTDKLETIEDPPGWFLRTSLQYLHT
ncbi:hypothetical protein HAX54_038197 [Datura stramonium]|uniref:F-box domain-containing protein n=1 Tax=Datura stramonium TaxID=4076 RepID=A0ABS8RN46_DATST|nr:hypothetical protein [Datura stramonium]